MWLRIYVMRAASFDLCVRDGTGICGRKRWAGGSIHPGRSLAFPKGLRCR